MCFVIVLWMGITLNYKIDGTHLIIVNNKLMQTDKFFLRGSHSTLHLFPFTSLIDSVHTSPPLFFILTQNGSCNAVSFSFISFHVIPSLTTGLSPPNHSYQRGFSGKWWESEDCAVILCVIRGGNPRKHLSPSPSSLLPSHSFEPWSVSRRVGEWDEK